MNVDIYVRERDGSREIRFPWLPEKIDYESGGVIKATYNIMDRGPVEVQTGTGLKGFSWESIFPGYNRTDHAMMRGEWNYPSHYHNILEDWRLKRTPLTLLVVGFPFNLGVVLDDYTASATGAFGDMDYRIKFVEDRDLVIQMTTTETISSNTERPAATSGSYTVKSGDNLWKIAQNKLGKGSRNKEIYNLNKEIIEATAKKHGKKSSNNGWWIYPGTKLTLPQK